MRRAASSRATALVACLALWVCGATAGGSRDDSAGEVPDEREAKRQDARSRVAQAAASAEGRHHGADEALVAWRVDGGGERWVRVVPTPPSSSTPAPSEPPATSSLFEGALLGLPSPAPLPPPPGSGALAATSSRARSCATRELTRAEVRSKEARRAEGTAARLRLRATSRDHRTLLEDDFLDAPFAVTVPVIFHVIHDGNSGLVSRERLHAQVDVLNRAFGGNTNTYQGAANADAADVGATFVFHGATYTDDSSWFREACAPGTAGEREIREALASDPASYLNVFLCEPPDGALGWIDAFPDEFPEDDKKHGVFLLHSTLPGGTATPYHLGDTAVHEVGHYLGLYHTFQGGCHDLWDADAGDAVFDTPPHARANHGACEEMLGTTSSALVGGFFESRPDTCLSPGESDATSPPYYGLDPVTNFMNYAVDSCMSEFTPGQAARVRETVEQFKPTLCANMPLGVCRGSTSVVAMSGPPSDATVSVAPPPPSTSHSANHPSTSCADETSSSFLVTLRADDFPTEIAWRLTREERIDETSGYLVSVEDFPEDEKVIASVAFGSLVEPGGEWSWRLCLEPGRYLFQLEDSWGDGLCCEWGEGRWDAWLDDVWIGGGDGNYGEGVTKKFDARVPEGTTFAPPRSAPPPPPPPPPPVAPSAPLDPPPAPASPAAPQDPPAPPNAPPPPPRPPRATLGGLLFPGRDFLGPISA
jgi:hypothetical protein